MKICVVGAGRMGRRHIVAAQHWEFCGVFDLNSVALREAGEELELADELLFDDFGAMLSKSLPDCVIVATTAGSHLEYVCRSAEARVKYILCEKPMATSITDCVEMIRTCEKFGSRLAVNHQMRYMPQFVQVKELVQSEALGGIRSMTMSAGNYGISMNGTHYFEAFRFITDSEIKSIQALLMDNDISNPRGREFKDRGGSVLALSADGQRLYMEIGTDQGHGCKIIYGCVHGQVIVDEHALTLQADCREEQYRFEPTTKTSLPGIRNVIKLPDLNLVDVTVSLLKDLFNDGGYPDGAVGMASVAAAVACHSSDESGEKVTLDRLDSEISGRSFPWA